MPNHNTTSKPESETATDSNLETTLVRALEESERIKAMVEQAASDISRIARVISQAMFESPKMSEIGDALQQISQANSKVRLAGSKLSGVNAKLQIEARHREMLDHRFAASVEQHEGTRHAALHDLLTGLPNRALFKDRLHIAIAESKRSGLTLAVMFLDLDDFKGVNDTYGHATGDRVLQIVGRRLKAHTRENDTVSRHGGDEFLYLAQHVRDEHNVELIAQKLLREIQAPMEGAVLEREIFAGISASIGISIYPKDGATPDLLIRGADAAMYNAKKNGGGFAFAP
jgi:diguanylate cyclase (GGDEF)-like protein